MSAEIMHMYDGNDRKVAELDIASKSGAEVADMIEIQEMVGRRCVVEDG